jgi:4-hydroxy-2-oxoheptanedioate aldolase
VQRVKYPLPSGAAGINGQRGSAFSTRAAGYGAFGGPAHTGRSNDGVVLVVMLETPEGVANAAAIAAVPGVDAVFVGPNDLAHTMGYENRFHEPAVQAAIEHALRAVAAAGKCPGVLALTLEDEDRYAGWGARYFATVTTGLISKALKEAAQGGRAELNY